MISNLVVFEFGNRLHLLFNKLSKWGDMWWNVRGHGWVKGWQNLTLLMDMIGTRHNFYGFGSNLC